MGGEDEVDKQFEALVSGADLDRLRAMTAAWSPGFGPPAPRPDLRRSRLWLRRDTFLKGSLRGARSKDVTWLHPSGREMSDTDWNDSALRAIAVHMDGAPLRASSGGDLLVVCNADDAQVELVLPEPPAGAQWQVLFDTSGDLPEEGSPRYGGGQQLKVGRQSTVLLESITS